MRADPRSAELIQPILRGEDIKAYVPQWAGEWLINSHNGVKGSGIAPINVKRDYKAIYEWLGQFSETLEKRYDKGDHWTNLRNCAYVEEFAQPKIIYPNMTKYFPFVYDKDRFFTNQKCFIITGGSLGYLTAFLNSRLFRFAYKDYFPELLGDTRELSKIFFETVSVKQVDEVINILFDSLTTKISELKRSNQVTTHLENEIEDRLAKLYCLSDDDIYIIKSTDNQ